MKIHPFNFKTKVMNWIKNRFRKHFDTPTKTSIHYFALLLSLALLCIGFFTKMDLVFVSVLAFAQLIGLIQEKFWRFEYALLTTITEPIGKLVSFAALSLLFFGLVTPLSFLRTKKFQSGWKVSSAKIDSSKLYE